MTEGTNLLQSASSGALASKGLRALSLSLATKLHARGKVNCSDCADELALEISNEGPPLSSLLAEGQRAMDVPGYDKNVRRRVYDALNVLVAVGAIVKDGKFIEWKGVEYAHVPPAQREYETLRARIEEKRAAIKELTDQTLAFKKLSSRNQAAFLSNSPPRLSSRVHCPFAVVRSSANGDISLETTEDQTMMHFTFSQQFDILTDSEVVLLLMNSAKSRKPSSPLVGADQNPTTFRHVVQQEEEDTGTH